MSPPRSILDDTHGSVLVEYVVVAAFAGIVVALALMSIGPRTVSNYSGQRGALYEHSP
jgi:hypothetical protein